MVGTARRPCAASGRLEDDHFYGRKWPRAAVPMTAIDPKRTLRRDYGGRGGTIGGGPIFPAGSSLTSRPKLASSVRGTAALSAYRIDPRRSNLLQQSCHCPFKRSGLETGLLSAMDSPRRSESTAEKCGSRRMAAASITFSVPARSTESTAPDAPLSSRGQSHKLRYISRDSLLPRPEA